MLTAEQKAIRERGLAASEVPAVAGLSPYESPIDVWLRKPTANRKAVYFDDLEVEAGPSEVGSILEPGLLALYRRRTGRDARPWGPYTEAHPTEPWALATPDGEVVEEGRPTNEGRLVELKCVGEHMTHHWAGGIPDYVRAQVEWQLIVTGRTRCDVAALLGGTRFEVFSVERDEALAAALLELGRAFWFGHVLTDTPPDPSANQSRKDYLRKRFRNARDVILDVPADHVGFVTQLVKRYAAADAEAKRAKKAADDAEAALCELVGEATGIRGPFGDITWRVQQGQPSYKAIAEMLAPLGVIPPALIEQHRGRPFRKFHYSPGKLAKARAARKGATA